MQFSHLYIPVFLSSKWPATGHSAIPQGQSRLASAMGRRKSSRRDPPEFSSTRIHRQAIQAATEPDDKATKEDYSLLDLPEVIVGSLYLRLSCTDALALGSTCRALQQLLRPLRFAKTEQYLKSADLAPDVQRRAVDWRLGFTGHTREGHVQLYFTWTVRASHILYHLVMKEKIPPDVLWAAVVPQMSISGHLKYYSVCCSFGCLDWVCGSMQFSGSQAFLYERLVQSDLARLDTTFRPCDVYLFLTYRDSQTTCTTLSSACPKTSPTGPTITGKMQLWWCTGLLMNTITTYLGPKSTF